MQIVSVAISSLVPNPWNPNHMDDKTFGRLKKEITEVGMLEPIQVVPLEDGTYRILGGEHRYRAAKELGHTEILCMLLSEEKWKDEDLQKFVTVRLNIVRGKLNPEKFVSLYREMADKYGEEPLRNLFAFTDGEAWSRMIKGIQKGLRKSGLPKEVVDQFGEVVKEARSAKSLGEILNDLLSRYGDTLKHNFMVFKFGNQDHIFVALDTSAWDAVSKVLVFCQEHQLDINQVIGPLTRAWVDGMDALPQPQVLPLLTGYADPSVAY
jgi:ParB-like chromosome segregation protein Spo0J